MDSLRSQYVRAPRGSSPQWWDNNAGVVTVNEFFGVPTPPEQDMVDFFVSIFRRRR